MRKYGIYARDIMTRNPITTSPNISVKSAVKLMLKYNVGSLLIVSGKELNGILTEKDIIKKVVAKGVDPCKVKVNEVMTKKVKTVTPEEDLYSVAALMTRAGIRRAPVVEGGRLVGMITANDLLKIEPKIVEILLDSIEIRESSSKPVKESNVVSGVCEVCGNYQDELKLVSGRYVCDACGEEVNAV